MVLIYDNFNFLSDIDNEFYLFSCMTIDLEYAKKILTRKKYLSMLTENSTANLLKNLLSIHIGTKKTDFRIDYDLAPTVIVFIPLLKQKYYSIGDIDKIKREKLYKIYLVNIENILD